MLIGKDLFPNRAQLPAASGLQQHFRPSMILGDTFNVDTDLNTPPDDQFVFPSSTSNRGQICKIRITGLEAGPVPIENAMGTLPNNDRDPLPGDKEQPASPYGV
jgi:hypothetical protein